MRIRIRNTEGGARGKREQGPEKNHQLYKDNLKNVEDELTEVQLELKGEISANPSFFTFLIRKNRA